MRIIEEISTALSGTGLDYSANHDVPQRGWDYWEKGKPATDGRGRARKPHLTMDSAKLPADASLILAPSMSVRSLTGGIWRQILVPPNAVGSIDFADDFAVCDKLLDSDRTDHLVALLGHSPRDLALYLDDLRRRDKDIFELVIAKRFKDALAACPDLLLEPWPDTVRRRWEGIQRDYLPPLLVAVLYAELARLAMNQAGLLEMAFDGEVELTTTQFLNRVPLAGHGQAPPGVSRAIDYAPFQSIALGTPRDLLRAVDRAASQAWASTAAARIGLIASLQGGVSVKPHNPEAAKALQDGYGGSPNFWPEKRKRHGWSRQPRAAANFWGLSWRRHAAVGLLEIASAAHAWNRQYRSKNGRLAAVGRDRLANAIAVINFGWIAQVNAEAALSILRHIYRSSKTDFVQFESWAPAQIDPFSIDLFIDANSGGELLKRAKKEQKRRPQPGSLGYTARYLPHLWFDNVGDDIEHYLRYQKDAVTAHQAAIADQLPAVLKCPSRLPENAVRLVSSSGRGMPRTNPVVRGNNHPAMTRDPAAARGAQLYAQALGPLSTDGLIELLQYR